MTKSTKKVAKATEYNFSFCGFINKRDEDYVKETKGGKITYSGKLQFANGVSESKKKQYAKALYEGQKIYISLTECTDKFGKPSFKVALGKVYEV